MYSYKSRHFKSIKKHFCWFLIGFSIFFTACGSQVVQKEYEGLRSPSTFILNGDQWIEENQPEKALSAFDQALQLEKNNSSALSGKALSLIQYANQKKRGFGQREWEKEVEAANYLWNEAESYAQTPEQEGRTQLYKIRLLTEISKGAKFYNPDLLHTSDWVKSAESSFHDLQEYPLYISPSFYYMAKAFDIAGQWKQASELLQTLKTRDSATFKKKAEVYSKELNDRLQLSGNNAELRRISQLSQIKREDFAVLLIGYFPLKRIFQKRRIEESIERTLLIKDAQASPFQTNIDLILSYDLRGMRLVNGKFDGEILLKRGELAMTLEDILVTALNQPEVRYRYIGQASHFPDVPSSHPSYNAIRTVIERNLIVIQDPGKNLFGLNSPVSGLEAMKALSKLRQGITF